MKNLPALGLALTLLLAACGGGGAEPQPAIDHVVAGRFVLRVQATATGYAALEERPAPYRDGLPSAAVDRRLRVGTPGGDHLYAPPEGWSLIDIAAHPSGELSAVLATHRELRLLRLDAQARVLTNTALTDPAAPLDPYYDDGGIKDDDSLLPLHTRDAVRLAALGEDLAVALRTGRHAVVAYRHAHSAQGYAPRWRRLLEPGTTVMARYLSSGSHDTYGQLVNHFQVLLAANAQGEIAVAVPAAPHNGAFAAHAAHFPAQAPAVLPDHGAILTRLDGAGQRLGATLFDSGGPTQVYALRAVPEGGWALAGRHKVAGQDGGWNGFAAWIDGAGRMQRHAVLHVDADDVLFDIAPLPDGRHLAAGATGYQQNPAGASISDQGAPLLAVLDAQGRIARRLTLPAAPGQNPVRSLQAHNGRWLVAGMRGGPGTHTADADPARLRADGYVLELALP
ncbi:hypothetical protein [Piscinibacter sp.]|uniref:hypothetical protein n=1 Tax=Piscinibacter sp. TaxID=1903157 RepID=UPI0039E2CFAB